MKIVIYPEQHVPSKTYAGNGGSNGLFLTVRGCPASFCFDSAAEAYEIAGAILAGLHKEIRETQVSPGQEP